MKRLLISGFLAGVLGLSVQSSPAFSQLPPLPSVETPPPAPAAESPEGVVPVVPHAPEPLPQTATYPEPKVPGYYGDVVVPGMNYGPTAWQPGGYTARRGRPYYYTTPGRNEPLYSVHQVTGVPWAFDHSAYRYHFGPGYYRHSEGGHYRFPYYTYRAPWYFPGHPIYNRDTNRPW